VDAGRDRAAGRSDKPLAADEVSARLVGVCAACALVADVPLSLAVGWRPGATHLVAVGSAWLYDLRLKETLASGVPYALSFGLLPVIIATALPGHPLPQPTIVAAAACLGVAAHFANTVGDAADDAMTGVRGLPQRVGPVTSIAVAAILVAVASGLLVAATDGAALTIAATVPAGAVLLALPFALRQDAHRHLAFGAVLVAVAVLVLAFVVAGGDRLVSR
jgi:4-hydroxybenzoate polyprenyltransferase